MYMSILTGDMSQLPKRMTNPGDASVDDEDVGDDDRVVPINVTLPPELPSLQVAAWLPETRGSKVCSASYLRV